MNDTKKMNCCEYDSRFQKDIFLMSISKSSARTISQLPESGDRRWEKRLGLFLFFIFFAILSKLTADVETQK
jgi:hypothetical protein